MAHVPSSHGFGEPLGGMFVESAQVPGFNSVGESAMQFNTCAVTAVMSVGGQRKKLGSVL